MNNIRNYTTKKDLKIGDIVYRPKGIIKHVGVYVGNKQVAHNSPDNNVEIIALDKFANDHEVKIVHNNLSEEKQNLVLIRIEEKIKQGQQYNLLTNNCEHFATDVIGLNKHSEQLQNIIVGLFIGYGVSRITKSEKTIRNTVLTGLGTLMLTNINKKFDTKYFMESDTIE